MFPKNKYEFGHLLEIYLDVLWEDAKEIWETSFSLSIYNVT